MTLRPEIILPLILLALAAYSCRAGGFFLMRYAPSGERINAALRATPLAVMIGIVAPAMVKAGPAEWLALAVALAVSRWSGRDIVAALLGVAAVALARFALG